jgi:hypothetical protein
VKPPFPHTKPAKPAKEDAKKTGHHGPSFLPGHQGVVKIRRLTSDQHHSNYDDADPRKPGKWNRGKNVEVCRCVFPKSFIEHQQQYARDADQEMKEDGYQIIH